MLSSGRLMAAMTACTIEGRAGQIACTVASSSKSPPSGSGAIGTVVQRRLAQSRSGGKDADDESSGPASSRNTPSSQHPEPPAPAPLQPPPASPESQALADKLRQSSPTGRLLDLFAPQGRQHVPRPGPPALSSAATAPSALPEAPPASDADVVRVVMRAVENCKPLMKVQSNKSGTKVVFVPKPLDPLQSTNSAVKWIVQAAQKRREASRGASMADCLALELLLAYQRKGSARAKRDEVHKLALDNRSNLRGRWW